MNFVFDPAKEAQNIRKHGLDFSFAGRVFQDPLGVTVYDRYDSGEHRYHRIGAVGPNLKVLLVVHCFPDPEDDELIRIIGLRAATAHERRRYEDNDP
jgi:uncharacterized DUF497 family protein